MTVSAPPRPPSPAPEAPDSKPLEREEVEALVEALLEEARRETRRRHRRYWALAALAAFVGAVVLILLDGGAASQTASTALSARPTTPTPAGTSMVAFDAGYIVGEQWHAEIYVVNADGSGRRNLTQDLGLDGAPVWSPDGRTIAFGRDEGILVMNVDGSERRRLTQGGSGPSWSPDGQKIAFWRNGNRTSYVMNADGSGLSRLARGVFPAWSPDGRKIAFVRERLSRCPRGRTAPSPCGSIDLYVVNADGSNPRKLAPDFLPAVSPPQFCWSPDGRRIAFVSKRDGNTEIYVMNADGSKQRRLTRTPSALRDRAPAWSPDGRRIAFVRSQFNAFEDIYVMNADGSGQRRVIRNGIAPRWSPDGQIIAFIRAVASKHRLPYERFQRDVWVASADGSDQRNLSHSPLRDDWLVGWSPGR